MDRTEQRGILQGISLRASDIAIRDVITTSPDALLRDAARDMHHARVNALPVVEPNGTLVGMIGIRDILRAPWPSSRQGGVGERSVVLEQTARELGTTTVGQVMARRLVTAGEDTPIAQLLANMVILGVHPIPIVASGRLTGVVSRSDLVSVLLSLGLSPDGASS